jgi:hypothetical protein
MRDDEDLAARRPVWRPRPAAVAVPEPYDGPVRCGGPILTVDERYELMKARKRELDEERARAEAEAAEQESDTESDKEKEKLPGRGDDEDEQRMLERFRNDRYSVQLLRQQNDAWGGPGRDGGALG